MGMRVAPGGRLVSGAIKKPIWSKGGRGLRLSQMAVDMGCVAAFLPANSLRPILITADGPFGAAWTVASTPTVPGTEEGPSLNFSATAQSLTVVLPQARVATGVGYSVVARLKGTASSTSISTTTAVVLKGAGGANRAAVSIWGSTGVANGNIQGGTASSSAQGSTDYRGTYVTVGVSPSDPGSASANFPAVYENGVLVATGATNAGQAAAGTTGGTIDVGQNLGIGVTTAYNGDIAWAFFFAKSLSAAEQWFVARNTWALLEPIHDNVLGSAPASGTTYNVSASYALGLGFTGDAKTTRVGADSETISLGFTSDATTARLGADTETISLAFNASAATVRSGSVSENVTLGFSADAVLAKSSIAPTENIALAFAPSAKLTRVGATSENVALGYSAIATAVMFSAVTQSVALGYSTTGLLSRLGSDSESVSLAWTATAKLTRLGVDTETLSLGFAATAPVVRNGAVVEPITLGFSASARAVMGAVTTYNVALGFASDAIIAKNSFATFSLGLGFSANAVIASGVNGLASFALGLGFSCDALAYRQVTGATPPRPEDVFENDRRPWTFDNNRRPDTFSNPIARRD